MRVYFNGSFSCGKTKLKAWVAKEYNLSSVPELFRTLIAEKEISNLDEFRADIDKIGDLQEEVIKRQFEYEKNIGDNFVACRGLDSLAFMIQFCNEDRTYKFLQSDLVKKYIEWIRGGVTYLVRPEKTLIKADGVRDTNWELSLEIYGSAKAILTSYGIKFIPINGKSMNDRQRVVKETIGEKRE